MHSRTLQTTEMSFKVIQGHVLLRHFVFLVALSRAVSEILSLAGELGSS